MSKECQNDATLLYCEEHTTPQDEVLYGVYRDIQLHTAIPHLSSTPYMGRVLAMLSRMIQPKVAVEVGVFGGYSSICIARSLAQGGVLHAIEAEEEFEPMIRRHLQAAAVDECVELHIGTAVEVIPTLPNDIDFAFVDADKLNYATYYNQLLPKMRRGGWLLFDNMLWYGNVVNNHADATTRHLQELNSKIQSDPRVENLLLPLGDGVMVCCIK